DLGLVGRCLRRGDHRAAGQSAGRAGGRHPDRRRRVAGDGGDQPGLGACRVVHHPDRAAALAAAMAMTGVRLLPAIGIGSASVPLPRIIANSPSGTLYLLGLIVCVGSLGIAWWVSRSRLGMGLFAIHDDEDVAEVKGVPTFRYKLLAFTLSGAIAGVVGGVHA